MLWAALRAWRREVKVAVFLGCLLLLGGRSALRVRDWRSDLDLWASAVATLPSNEKAHFNLGVELEKAYVRLRIVACEGRVSMGLGFGQSHVVLHVVCDVHSGLHQAALEQFRTAADINPTYSAARLRLAVMLHEDGRTEESLDHYSAALEADPGHSHIHNNVGGLFYQHKRCVGCRLVYVSRVGRCC